MLVGNVLYIDETTTFRRLHKDSLNFAQVFEEILEFIRSDINSSYRISIGTDSQVGKKTVFVTCIHVHRLGKGAIGFLHKCETSRQIRNLREKIYMETCATLQLAYLFEDNRMKIINEVSGKNVDFEFHIDIGAKGETKTLINEMMGMVTGISFKPKIKPDSYCSSCFADRYTKAM